MKNNYDKEMENEKIKEINRHIREGVNQWADICLLAEADQWAVDLEYGKLDVMNVCYLFQHVCSNVGIKAGIIDEQKAVELGGRLHSLVLDMTGIDTFKAFED